MRNYTYTEDKMTIGEHEVPVYYPTTHSTVKAIAYKYDRWDENAGDTWANIVRMKEYIILYVLWKGHNEWDRVVDGSKNDSRYELSYYSCGTKYPHSFAKILFELETKEVQRKFELIAEKKELKKKIKECQKDLKKLEKDLKLMCKK